MTLRASLEAALADAVAGRPVVLLGRLPRSAIAPLGTLRRLGAGPFLAVSYRAGPTPGAAPDDTFVLRSGPADPDFILEVAAFEAALRAPSDRLRAALARFDPECRAVLIGPNHLDCPALLGRPRLGGRQPLDLALEDKTTIDALWAELGLPHLPSRVVPMDGPGPTAAAAALDRGHGTVWAADNTAAVEGGAIATRWVHDAASERAARALLGPRCARVRVMPFQAGLPMSIHAWVLARGVAVVSPMEMVVLRDPTSGAFRFCGAATTWTPDAPRTREIRQFARTVATHLHGRGYRGALSIDGVLGAAGFVPTELNARFPAGLSQIAHKMDGLPLALADGLIRRGGLPDLSPAALQAVLRATVTRHPIAWLHMRTPRAPSAEQAIGIVWEDGDFRRAAPGEPASSTLHWSEGQVGGALRLSLPAPPRGVTGARLLKRAVRAAGPPLATELAGWRAARPPT